MHAVVCICSTYAYMYACVLKLYICGLLQVLQDLRRWGTVNTCCYHYHLLKFLLRCFTPIPIPTSNQPVTELGGWLVVVKLEVLHCFLFTAVRIAWGLNFQPCVRCTSVNCKCTPYVPAVVTVLDWTAVVVDCFRLDCSCC